MTSGPSRVILSSLSSETHCDDEFSTDADDKDRESPLRFKDYPTINEEFYKKKPWTNEFVNKHMTWKDIVDSLPYFVKAINNFREYLNYLFPINDATSNESRLLCQLADGSNKGVRGEKLSAFIGHLFPPINVKTSKVNGLLLNDTVPQFGLLQEGKKYVYQCLCCPLYVKEKEQKRARVIGKLFEGVSQLYQHGKSKFHREAVRFLTETSMPAKEVNSSVTIMARFLQKNIKTQCCENIMDKEIVENFCEDQIIHRMSADKVFSLNSKFQCKEHKGCKAYSQWKIMHPDENQKLLKLDVAQAIFIPIVA